MYIVSISVDKREKDVPEIQEVLTKYGANIVARFGLQGCAQGMEGLIIVVYKEENVEKFTYELNHVKNVIVNHMKV
jgi:hypothetical protein